MTKTKTVDIPAHMRLFRIGICLLTILLLSMLPSQKGMAAKATNSVLTGACGKHSTWKYNKNTKVLTISGKGAAFLNRKGTTFPREDIRPERLVVKPGITAINYYIIDVNKKEGFRLQKLMSVSLPDSLRAIEGPLFIGCGIASLTIPKNVNRLDAIPFLDSNIKKLQVHPDNKYFVVDKDGVLFTKDKKTLVYYPITKKTKTYRFPDSVTKIGDMAFCSNPFLKKVILTKNIYKIGNGAFAYCRNLRKINVQVTKVKQIQDYNGNKYGLKSNGRIYTKLDYIDEEILYYEDEPEYCLGMSYSMGGYFSFQNCGYDNNQGVEYISSDNDNYFGTFQGTNLQSFVMPDTLQYAGKQTFYPSNRGDYYSCYGPYWAQGSSVYDSHPAWTELRKVVIGKNFRGEINGGKSGSQNRRKTLDLHLAGFVWVNYRFKETYNPIKIIQVHPKNKKYKIKDNVLYSKNMDTLYMSANTIPKKLTVSAKTHYIARGAFYGNHTLQSIMLKGRIYRIGQSSFERCVHLKNVTFLKPVDRIEQSAFDGASRNMVLKGKSIRYIGKGAFISSVKKMDFDSSKLRYIGEMAFRGSEFKTLKLKGSLRYIGDNAFYYSEVQNLQIHSTTDLTVRKLAFQYCRKLKQVSITSDKKLTLQREVFKRTKIGKVTLSKGAVIHRSGLRIPTEEYPSKPVIVWK